MKAKVTFHRVGTPGYAIAKVNGVEIAEMFKVNCSGFPHWRVHNQTDSALDLGWQYTETLAEMKNCIRDVVEHHNAESVFHRSS